MTATFVPSPSAAHDLRIATVFPAVEKQVERSPGRRLVPAAGLPGMRLREIEIHHVDLGLAYRPDDWPASFVRELLGYASARPGLDVDARLVATDLSWEHQLGQDGPTVSGPGHALAWWLTGRPPYEGGELSVEGGELPQIGAL